MVKSQIEFIKLKAQILLEPNTWNWLEVTEELREELEGVEVYAASWDLLITNNTVTNDTNTNWESLSQSK